MMRLFSYYEILSVVIFITAKASVAWNLNRWFRFLLFPNNQNQDLIANFFEEAMFSH